MRNADALEPALMTVLLSVDCLDCGSLTNGSFDIAPGERICLGGPSGSGKTRLLRALADLDPHSGHIRLQGARSKNFHHTSVVGAVTRGTLPQSETRSCE
jgi:ABC-type Fe3+/spermidine/putrescine transport system ATPase subunit